MLIFLNLLKLILGLAVMGLCTFLIFIFTLVLLFSLIGWPLLPVLAVVYMQTMNSIWRWAWTFATVPLGVSYSGDEPQMEASRQESTRRAAKRGDTEAQINLAEMYASGYGEIENYVAAYAWYSVAAGNDHKLAVQKLAELKADLTPDELAAGDKLAASLLSQINANKAY
jgi:hypothetical protein